ncbi:MAG: glutamate 5-kinase [Candidatus Omnitrophica bacterium]|nr:glutamate 5-kinase [Candidatus Omnitrophota bacterium]MBU1996716.1 glutamate 5-kinase [Candidatus Omnitrophota bacterium]MBU4334837.1 glutamate 5-kinase [Candidatus Omnitrophota bacterium]
MSRKFPRKVRRIVVKVGSSVIATYKMKPRTAQLRSLAAQICKLKNEGIDVILVSSGAIVLGMGELNHKTRPGDLATIQALAAIGQTVLMKKYNELFAKYKSKCAQVLLTWDDFDNRSRFNNARNTLKAMLDMGIIPIINENDTVSTDEIKFGDNDKLSSLVASLVQADLLVMLSDVDGLYDLNSKDKKIFEEIQEITREIEGIASGAVKKHISKGGMKAKLEAVKVVTQANIPCIIANGKTENVLLRILKGERIGTYFLEKKEKLLARKHWISFGVKPKGVLVIDDGAKDALLKGGMSLLLPGIVSWDGHFKKDDVVVVQDKSKNEIARGVVSYSMTELQKIKEKKGKLEAIHRDNLVLCAR